MNMRYELRKAPLPSGVFVVRGEQGAGKTSFVTALLCADYKRWRRWRTVQGQALAQQFYRDNGIKLAISDRLYFSNIDILLDKRKNLHTHAVDVQRLALPNDDFVVQYFPQGSVIFIQEADLQLFCRDWNELNAYLIALLKHVRHNLLTVIFDCQVDGALDKAVRRLTVGVYHIMESYTRRFFLFWKPRTWRFLYIRNQLNDVLKELAAVGVNINVPVVERGRFRFFGDVFARYNSFSGVPYFLKGIEATGYEYIPHVRHTYSAADIAAYCDAHPLVKPEETKRGRRRRRADEGNSDV